MEGAEITNRASLPTAWHEDLPMTLEIANAACFSGLFLNGF